MNNRKKLRQLKYLMSKYSLPFDVLYVGEKFNTFKETKIKDGKEVIEGGTIKYGRLVKQYEDYLNIFKYAEELGIGDDDLKKMWIEVMTHQREQSRLYSLKPQKEGRDNKGVYVGTGGSNRNKVRYPSKKRSKRTWKTFYTMFPRLAEQDGWDGKKSKKM